ncbi:MAG: hypothetical protein WAU01_14510 [Saprospiraceae bacterium]
MITHILLHQTKTVSGFSRFSTFIVLCNNIDSFVNIGNEEFENWADFTKNFRISTGTLDFHTSRV